MDKNINYTIVGIFVVCFISAITLSVIWLSSNLSFAHSKTYMIYMTESVSGLNVDSPVEFNGVDVGTVSDVTLDPSNPKQVKVLVSINSATPVTQGTVATLNTRGFTGITYVALKDRSLDLRPIQPKKGEPYPIIRSGPSLFLRLDGTLRQVSTDFHKITQSIEMLLNQENQRSVKKILKNLENITTTFSGSDEQLLPMAYRALKNFNDASERFGELASELQQNPALLIRGRADAPLGPGE